MIKDVPAWRVKAHIDTLLSQGWTRYQIIVRTGLDRRLVYRLANGEAKWCSQHTADLILGIPDCQTEIDCLKTGAVRRVNALMLQGWCEAEIERRCNVRCGFIRGLRQGMKIGQYKLPKLRQFVDDLRPLFGSEPPLETAHQRRDAAAAKNKAKRLGYLDLIVWDDVDDPSDVPHLPDKGRKELPRHGTPSGAKRHRRLGEKPCLACQEAENASKRERKAA